ncbi:MAG: tetratricopeptide repeat protein [Planctomycetota bacterium]
MSGAPVKRGPRSERGVEEVAEAAPKAGGVGERSRGADGEGAVVSGSGEGSRSRRKRGVKGWLVTNWRLALVIGVVLGIGSGVSGFAFWRYAEWRLETRDLRLNGFVAYDQDDFTTAASLLGDYVARRPEDSSALFRLGMSRLQSRPVTLETLHEARVTLQQVLELDNDNHAARRGLTNVLLQLARVDPVFFDEAEAQAMVLFGVYPRDTYAFSVVTQLMMRERRVDEAIALADSVLNAEVLPEAMRDAAMLVKARAYQRKGDLEDAIFWAESCVKESAANLEAQRLYLQLAEQLNREPESYARHAKRLFEARPDVAMNRVMYAVASQSAARRAAVRQDREAAARYGQQALELLRGTAELELTSEEMALVLQQLEQLRATTDVMGFLESQIGRSDSGWLQTEYVRRALLLGQPDKVLATTAELDAGSAEVSAELVGLRVLAMIATGADAGTLRPMLEGLAARRGEALADAWLLLLSMQGFEVPGQPAAGLEQGLEVIDKALAEKPRDPFLLRVRGRLLEPMGRVTAARGSYSEAARWAPYWHEPAMDLARSYSRSGQVDQMLRWAQDAVRRRPDVQAAQLLLVDATLRSGEGVAPERLTEMVSAVEAARAESPGLVPLLVRLKLEADDRAGAEQAIAEAWADEAVGQATRRELAGLAVSERLAGAERYVQSLMDGAVGAVDLQLARMELVLNTERLGVNAALDRLESRRQAASDSGEPGWAILRATAMTRSDPAGARELMGRVSAAHADNVRVQMQVLGLDLAWDDPELVRAALERARAAEETETEQLRVFGARYQLHHGSGPDEWGQAVRTLLEVVQANPRHAPIAARLLLIQASAVFNMPDVEVQQRTRLQSVRPTDLDNVLGITRRLTQLGRDRMAERLLDRVGENPRVDAYELARVEAINHADRRRYDRAIQTLERHYVDAGTPTPPDAFFGSLYVEAGRSDRASAIAEALIEAGSAEQLIQGAGILAQIGSTDRLESLLAELGEREMDAGERAFTRSRLEVLAGRPEDAMSSLRAAVEAEPGSTVYRLELMSRLLERGDMEGAAALAADAPGDDARFGLLAPRRELVRLALLDPLASQVLRETLRLPERVERDVPVLELLVRLSSASESERPSLIDELVREVDRSPRRLGPQAAALGWLIRAERWSEAARRAQRASLLLPNQSVLLSTTATALLQAGDLSSAQALALAWRNRLGDTWPADRVLIRVAGLQARLDDPDGVRDRLGGYLRQAESMPGRDLRVTRAVASELLQSGRVSEVVAIYAGLPADEGAWRESWPSLAAVVAGEPEVLRAFIEAVPGVAGESPEEMVILTQALSWRNAAVSGAGASATRNAVLLLRPLVDRQSPPSLALNLYGNLALETADYAKAEDAFTKLLVINEDDVTAKNNLAMALMLSGRDLERAETLAREALAVLPDQPAVMDTVARVLVARGREADALPYLERAVERQPLVVEWQLFRAEVLLKLGREPEARVVVNRIREDFVVERMSSEERERLQALESRLVAG